MKTKYILIILFIISFSAVAQEELPLTQAYRNAVEKGTRTLNGEPGENYWQNSADYDIVATLFPSENLLKGSETIIYQNNSNDVLNTIVIHLFQNLYKKGAARDAEVNEADLTNGMVIDSLFVNSDIDMDYTIEGTQLIVTLREPLNPSNILELQLYWQFNIPTKSNIRMGAKDETSFFLGQWYPKIAVYDDIKGWDRNMHLGSQEFYNDKGNYRYKVNVPKGYLVWGTGVLKNAKSVLNEETLMRYRKALKSDDVIHIIREHTAAVTTNDSIWHFEAKNVPDIAFGMSNHFLWDATSIQKSEKERVLVSAVYPKESNDFKEVAELSKKAIDFFSNTMPGITYPYPAMTVFNGTNGLSGMEYCMIVNNPSVNNRGRTVDVTAHEIAHTFFPFTVLTNETDYAWMDEGFASILPYKFQQNNEPSSSRIIRYAKEVSEQGETVINVPTMTNSNMLNGSTSYFNNYMKPALALYVLEDLLGTKIFNVALQNYINQWTGKHPLPYDFFYSVNSTSNLNLNWFWKKWFFENAYPDLKIVSVRHNVIAIEKVGTLPVPVILQITYDDGRTENLKYTASIWKDTDYFTTVSSYNTKIAKIVLGNDYIPDTDLNNNYWKSSD